MRNSVTRLLLSLLLFLVIVGSLSATPLYTFEVLLEAAQQNNTTLHKAQQELQRSLLDVKDAKGKRWPTIDFTLSGTYMVNPQIGPIVLDPDEILGTIEWPAGFSPVSGGDYITLYDGMENTHYQAEMTLTQPIFTWGKISKAIKLTQQLSNIRSLQLSDQRSKIESELAIHLDALYHLGKIADLLEEGSLIVERLEEIAKEAYASGLILELDLLKATVGRSELEIAQEKIAHQQRLLLLNLRTLCGISNLELTSIDHSATTERYHALLTVNSQELINAAISSERPTISALSLSESLAKTAVDLEKANLNWKPDLALVVSVGYGGPRLPLFETDWYRQNDYTLNLTLGLQTTIWDGGEQLRAVKRRISEQESASSDAIAAREQIIQTLSESLSALRLALANNNYLEKKIAYLDENIKIEEAKVAAGYGEEGDYLQVQLEYLNTKIALEQNLLEASTHFHTISLLSGWQSSFKY
ncbi:MAG: TolC family protein [Sphaerochaetaceae bacterium]|jgi:outer membrane protein TolC|nr:TolC family protein [Sphaerochaetaceae bacterium]HHU89140.1 TolC family protein [Spirochaetales bacterium]